MHQYHYGSFDDAKLLSYGHDYQLGGVRVGDFKPNNTKLKLEHAAPCLSEHQSPDNPLTCVPRGTYATVTLPWPQDFSGVCTLLHPPQQVFQRPEVNPTNLYYIAYLKYLVDPEDTAVLTRCCDHVLWTAPDPTAKHTRLHFYADPFVPLERDMVPTHLSDAFHRLNDQCFGGNFLLTPNVPAKGFKFGPSHSPIPADEAKDFKPNQADAHKHDQIFGTGTGGNCFQVVVLD